MNITEDFVESCKSILEFLVKENDPKIRKLKYRDFRHKFDNANLKFDDFIENKSNPNNKEKFDVIIFTIVPVEFNTFRTLFLEEVITEFDNINGLGYYPLQIIRGSNKKPLKALVTLVGSAGDVNCSLVCSRTFQRFHCDLAILCGIAAGYKKEIKKYSCVVSELVTNYEFQRIEGDKEIVYRPEIFDIDPYFKKSITAGLIIHKESWKKVALEDIKKILKNDSGANIPELPEIDIKSGVIASGAKLLADGKTIANLHESIPLKKGIIAVEMEGSGFSPACKEYNVKWLIFRGISDYGEKDKNSKKNKKYQCVAAASAVTSMMFYLKNIYLTPEERGEVHIKF